MHIVIVNTIELAFYWHSCQILKNIRIFEKNKQILRFQKTLQVKINLGCGAFAWPKKWDRNLWFFKTLGPFFYSRQSLIPAPGHPYGGFIDFKNQYYRYRQFSVKCRNCEQQVNKTSAWSVQVFMIHMIFESFLWSGPSNLKYHRIEEDNFGKGKRKNQ